MSTSTILYKNNLRTEATHTASGQVIFTDAPIDNNGKGEAFSPTDLVATAPFLVFRPCIIIPII